MKYHFCYFVLKISLFIASKVGRYDYIDEIINIVSRVLIIADISNPLYEKYNDLLRSAVRIQMNISNTNEYFY